jgi:hypothetical protein
MLPVLWAKRVVSSELSSSVARIAALTRSIRSRSLQALTGSKFADYVLKMDSQQREQAILSEVLEGNLPNFLRMLVPVEFKYQLANAKTFMATVFAMPDYLAIGSDEDFLRIPMNLHTAAAIAARFGFILPTRKMVDVIYGQSAYHFAPEPLPAGPRMRSTEYYQIHNEMIEKQSRAHGVRLGTLVSGHKKDVVITNRLAKRPGQIAIYGWHRATGAPIQPLSTVHGAGYADYSHGIRLISETAIIDGKLRSMYDILQDSLLANVLSDEGAIRILPEVIVASRRERLTLEQDQTGLAPDDLPDTSGSMRRRSLRGQSEQ